MAIPPLLLCFYFLITLFPSSSISQQLFLPLTHPLSNSKFTSTHHLLKTTTTMSATRHRRHANPNTHNQQVSLPLASGSDYTLSLTVNSQTLSVFMDTGSDLVWFPCSPFECILCEGKFKPGTLAPLNLSKSSLPLSCKSTACSSAHSSLPSSDLCAIAKCPLDQIETEDCAGYDCPSFYFAYGDGSLVAKLHKDNLIMPSNSNTPLILRNFTFGCAHSALAEPIGVAGFGRGALSFPAQLANSSPELGNQFSYCLVSHSFDSDKLRQPSPLIIGKYKRKIDGVSEFAYTPMLDNPKHPYFYSVGLDAISVGSRRIPAPANLQQVDSNGNGGVVVDSGTTYTMLPTEFYNSVATELDRRLTRVLKRASDTEMTTGLNPCYYMGSSPGFIVPSLSFHYGGNSSVTLPIRNYFYEFMDGGDAKKKIRGKKVGCLMLMDGGDDTETGPGATLGNYQQQGFEVVYDLEAGRVGFAPRKCASMWENLTEGSTGH